MDQQSSSEPPPEHLAREVRLLKAYAVVSSLVLAFLLLTALRPGETRFGKIEAERIDILNADGDPALVLAGHGRLPGPTFEGREYPRELSGGRTTASGMIFFNERGDEVGGLTYHGELDDDGYSAYGGITFDQFRQDQVVSVQYQDDGARRSAGLQVWDRSTEISIAEILEVVDARREATGAARDSLERIVEGWREQGLGAHRVFLGSADRTAELVMRDAAGRPRVRLYVDSAGAAGLEFLDEDGEVAHILPD